MGYNIYQDQLIGPFLYNEEIMNKIQAQSSLENFYVWHLGITAEPGTSVLLEREGSKGDFIAKIGITGMYEIGNTKIFSIKPQQNWGADTIIDYVIQPNE